MGASDRTVNVIIKARDEASRVLKGLGLSFRNVAIAAAAVTAAVAATAVAIAKVTQAAAAQEQADIKLAFALRSIGENTAEVRDDLNAFIGDLQQTTVTADDVTASVIGMLAQVGRIGGEELKRATRSTLDLAAAMNIDLKAAAILVAKAAAGDVSALSRYGLKLDEAIPPTEKFAALLELLEKNFGGTAAVASKTLSGALTLVKLNMGDVVEQMGKGLVEGQAFRGILGVLSTSLLSFREELEESPGALRDVELAVVGVTLAMAEFGTASLQTVIAVGKFATSLPNFIKLLQEVGNVKAAKGLRSDLDQAVLNFGNRAKAAEESASGMAASIRVLEGVAERAAAALEELRGRVDFIGPPEARGVAALGEGLKPVPEIVADIARELDDVDVFDKLIEGTEVWSEQLQAANISAFQMAENSHQFFIELGNAALEMENIDAVREEFTERFGNETLRMVDQFGDALVQAAVTGEFNFKNFITGLLVGLARARISALLLQAALAFGTGGASSIGPGGIPLFGSVFGLQTGGIVPGRRGATDSVLTRLTPGEIVLPRPVADAFQEIIRASREGQSSVVPGGGMQAFIQIQPAPDRLQQAIELAESINELAEHQGMRVVATELVEG